MPKLPLLTAKELAKVLAKLGFEFKRQEGSHMIFEHPDGRKITIPHHSGEELGPGLLTKIIKHDLKITREEFLSKL